MTPDALDHLRLRQAEVTVEALTATNRADRRRKAEALQQALWMHRDALISTAIEHEGALAEIRDLRAALLPFGRAALLLPEAQNPVLLSLPSPEDGGRTFVQFRAADFHRARRLALGGGA